jgi:hypothetical protein
MRHPSTRTSRAAPFIIQAKARYDTISKTGGEVLA